jgi:hypothetical protein
VQMFKDNNNYFEVKIKDLNYFFFNLNEN